jgi:hypothetical protein
MFREILDKALGRDAVKADVAQMIVLIDYKPQFCDYANFTKYDPEYWFQLADDVSTNSDAPELSLGLWAISASQFFFDGAHHDMKRAKDALMRGMSLRKEHPVLQTIGKAAMLSEVGALDGLPKREDIVTDGLESAIRRIDMLETLINEDFE